MIALDLRIDAVMKIRRKRLVCVVFTTEDGNFASDERALAVNKSKILHDDQNFFMPQEQHHNRLKKFAQMYTNSRLSLLPSASNAPYIKSQSQSPYESQCCHRIYRNQI